MKQAEGCGLPSGERKMEREKFVNLVEEALGALPAEFRKRIHNVAVIVENVPAEQRSRGGSRNTGTRNSDDATSSATILG